MHDVAPSPAKLRTDLRVIPQDGNGQRTFVVKNPTTRRFFRLKEVELYIAEQLDGLTSLEEIQERVERRFRSRLSRQTLQQFVHKLGQLDLLHRPGEGPAQQRHTERRMRGGLLYLRFKAFNPDRLFTRLAKAFSFCFTPAFVVFSTGMVLAAAAVAVANWSEILGQVSPLLGLDTLLLAWAVLILVTVLHEFAHGVTCKHFGGEVPELGFMLIYFQPALYCNVSDAWLFPEKRKRLWVTLAGAYFEAVLWAVATLTWRVIEPGSWLSSIALIVLVTSAIKTFFNLNPLIKLDGYYLLSDIAGIPNLREKAFRRLGEVFRLKWGRRQPRADGPGARERWICLIYGLLAAGFSLSLLWLLAAHVGSFLVERHQAAGFILFSFLLLVLLRRPLWRASVKTARLLKPRRGLLPFLKWCLKLLLVTAALAGAGAALFFCEVELRVAGNFKVLPTHRADVRAEAEGILSEILVDEGDHVEQGMVIARLSPRDYEVELARTRAEIDAKRAALKLLAAGPRREEVDLGNRKLETAKTRSAQAARWLKEATRLKKEKLAKIRTTIEKSAARVKYSRVNLDRLRELQKESLVSSMEFEEAEELVLLREKELEESRAELAVALADDLAEMRKEVAVASGELQEAEAALKVLLAGCRKEEIEGVEAQILSLEAHRAYLQGLLELLVLASPSSGVITTPKLKEKIGQQVRKGDVVAEIQELRQVRVDISISEKDAGDLQVGQPVALKARAHPDAVFQAEMAAIAPAAGPGEQPGQGPIVLVTTVLDDPGGILKPGMTGMAKISCGKRPLYEVITRRLYRYLRVEFWSWW